MNPLFKDPEFKKQAEQFLRAPLLPPNGDVRQISIFSSFRFSQWLCGFLENEFQQHLDWLLAEPILLGSWGRQELSLRSDLDVLFVGPQETVLRIVSELNQRGFKLRYRVPANKNDWSEGVDLFDLLALLDARPLTADAAEKLFLQQKKIFLNLKKIKKDLIQRLQKERLERNLRYDSVANYLEPNLKYGPGGLRDIQQAQQMIQLFADELHQYEHAAQIFNYYKQFFLNIRNKANLLGADDQFTSQTQAEVSQWLGYPDKVKAMREIQRGLERVHFYSDWLLERIISSKNKTEILLKSETQCLDLLLKKPTVVHQKTVRTQMDAFFKEISDNQKLQFRKKAMNALADPKLPDAQIQALFRSKLIHYILPEIKRLDGLVQHDQYHRYTVETHILQARREALRFLNRPVKHKTFKELTKSLTLQERKILCLLSLYHDLGKGTAKDHSQQGAQFAEKDLTELGFSEEIVNAVSHLTLRHLDISQAAFRKNPQAIETWKALEEKGISGRVVDLLTAWTRIDILATNPETWNPWKENLLASLYKALKSETNLKQLKLQRFFEKHQIHFDATLFDSFLLEEFPANSLEKDLTKVLKLKKSDDQVFKGKSGVWIRCFDPQDRVGLLRDQIKRIFAAGFSVQHALVQTLPEMGAYNWIRINQKQLTQDQLMKRFKQSSLAVPDKEIEITQFEFERLSDQKGILIFKGKNQSGFLLKLLSVLTEEGFNIQYSQIHTWGQRIEDSFEVVAGPDFEASCQVLSSKIQGKTF